MAGDCAFLGPKSKILSLKENRQCSQLNQQRPQLNGQCSQSNRQCSQWPGQRS